MKRRIVVRDTGFVMREAKPRIPNPEPRRPMRFLGSSVAAGLILAGVLWADGAWRQALPGFVFEFPRDHASHPEYKIEWWYYTGNLASDEQSGLAISSPSFGLAWSRSRRIPHVGQCGTCS